MKQALGLVEIQGLATAVLAADAMVKAANIQILEIENSKGLGYMAIKVSGDVGDVDAAVNVGCQVGRMNGKLISWKVIPRPSDTVAEIFGDQKKSASNMAETMMQPQEAITPAAAEIPEKPAEAPAAEMLEEPEKPAEAPAAETLEEPEKPAEAPAAETLEEPEKPAEAPATKKSTVKQGRTSKRAEASKNQKKE